MEGRDGVRGREREGKRREYKVERVYRRFQSLGVGLLLELFGWNYSVCTVQTYIYIVELQCMYSTDIYI